MKNKRAIDAEQSQTPVKLEDMYEEFSETEKADISYAWYSYDRMAEMEQYLDESLYMQIEPYHMQQSAYQFQIKLDVALDTVEERTEAQNQILSAYIAYIRNGGLADSVAESKELKGDYTAAQIKELLDVSYDSAMQTNGGLCLYVYGTNLVPGLDELAKETLIQYAGELKNVEKHIGEDSFLDTEVPLEIISKFYVSGVINVCLEYIKFPNKYRFDDILEYLKKLLPNKIY